MAERRAERQNEVVMMKKIDEIISILGIQSTKIAVIETKAIATEEHLRTLNGKVQGHESRLQAQEGIVALNTRIIGSFVDAAKESRGFWERNWEKLFFFILACAWAYFMTNK